MKKKRSIILISILIIVSAVIYFYKPQHNKNNSYQLGIIISIGNKDKSNILYYNDQLQKTGQKKLKIGNIASQYDIPKTVNDKVYMIPKGVPYVNEREEVMELDHNTQKIKLYKIGRPGLFAFDEKDGDIYTTNWINGVSTLTKYNEETGKIQRYEESVGMFGYLALNSFSCLKLIISAILHPASICGSKTFLSGDNNFAVCAIKYTPAKIIISASVFEAT